MLVIACLLIPGFELRAALRARPRLALEAAALAPLPGREPLLGPVTTAAEAAGVQSGMRMGEALATCPELVLVDPDPAAVEQEWEGVLHRLEDAGFAVDPAEPGVVVLRDPGRGAAVRRLGGGAREGARCRRELPGIHVRAQGSAGSSPSRRRASRAPGRW